MSASVITGASNGVRYKDKEPESVSKLAKQIPEPSGYRILIALPEIEEKTEGGIYITDERKSAETVASIVGYVMKMGPDCYSDSDRFPNGPWCNVGDWVLMNAYSGTRFKIGESEFRLINDDSVQAVVENPLGIVRV